MAINLTLESINAITLADTKACVILACRSNGAVEKAGAERNIGEAIMRVARRRFLYLTLGSGAALGLAAVPAVWRGQNPASAALHADAVTTRTARALGSDVSMTVLGLPRDRAERALNAAFDELETVEAVMSLYRAESQLCKLNRSKVLDQPHPFLFQVLDTAQQTAEQTGGAFDITVQPLWALYSQAKKRGRLPTATEIAAARRHVDWRQVEVSPQQIRLRGTGTEVTLNGIAQGFATDRAICALRDHGVEHALVDAGEIGPLGRKPSGESWNVGIQHPRVTDAYLSLAKLDGRSLATSGDYETAFSDDFRVNHIFDPATGVSPQEFASVSIVAPTAMQADVLSTAVMVLGPERGLKVIASLPGVDAFMTLKNGRTLSTAGFPESKEV